MSEYIPLHESPLQRDPLLQNCFFSWWEPYGTPFGVLTPQGWFTTAHAKGCFLWDVPPATGEASVEQLGKARHKRSQAVHIFVCPRLMTYSWRKTLGKNSDIFFTVPVGSPVWPASQHEPLVVVICLPLLSHRPWTFKGSSLVDRSCGDLRGLSPDTQSWGRDLLRKFLSSVRSLASLPRRMVWEVLRPAGRG